MKYATAQDVRDDLRSRIGTGEHRGRLYGRKPHPRSQRAVAKHLGIHEVELCQFLNGTIEKPSIKLLSALGYQIEPYWRKE